MKLHEFMSRVNYLIKENSEVLEYNVATHETILGFMEDIEDIVIDNDPFTDQPVVAIQFRNQ